VYARIRWEVPGQEDALVVSVLGHEIVLCVGAEVTIRTPKATKGTIKKFVIPDGACTHVGCCKPIPNKVVLKNMEPDSFESAYGPEFTTYIDSILMCRTQPPPAARLN
jgi:Rieske Fe-S protein